MQLTFRRFQREHYAEHAAWFADSELNRQLGPMDEEWLAAVLSESESEGRTFSIFREDEMVAVLGMSYAPDDQLPIGINAIAVKPALRRQGIGTAVLREFLFQQAQTGQTEFVCYISRNNQAAQKYVKKIGFFAVTNAPDENGYLEFRYGQQANSTAIACPV